MAEIGRVLTAMVTPFTEEGEVNYSQARKTGKVVIGIRVRMD